MHNSFPTRLNIANYRGFDSEVSLLIRPLTLIYGRNNAGKSALLRTLRLLDPNAKRDSSDGNILRVLQPPYSSGSLEELLPRGRDAVALGLTLEWMLPEGSSVQWHYSLEITGHEFRVSELSWENVNGHSGSLVFQNRSKKYVMGSSKQLLNLSFEGLVPRGSDAEGHPPLKSLQECLLRFSDRVHWLQATRSIPIRELYPRQDSSNLILKPDASNCLELLATQQKELLPEINRWYRGYPSGLNGLERLTGAPERELVFQDLAGRGYEVRLTPARIQTGQPEQFRLTLAESGEGMSHVLPVLLGIELARQACMRDLKPALFAVEEPESHLHADAQRALAQYMAGAVLNCPDLTLAVETHSWPLLLALQVEVANKRLGADKVAINWVELTDDGPQVRAFTLDAQGLPNAPGMPDYAFSEIDQLRDLLIDAQP